MPNEQGGEGKTVSAPISTANLGGGVKPREVCLVDLDPATPDEHEYADLSGPDAARKIGAEFKEMGAGLDDAFGGV